MTTTATRHNWTLPSGNGAHSVVQTTSPGRRNRTRIAVGIVVIFVCMLAAATIYSSSNRRVAALVVQRQVAAGSTIAASDLGVAQIAASGVRTVDPSTKDRLVGRVASRTLLPGTLLAPDDVGDAAPVPTGMAVVGASLKPGQYPDALSLGDNVTLIETASTSAVGNAAAPNDDGHATVVDVAAAKDSTDGLLVSLLVPASAAPEVVGASAGGRLSVAVVAP